MSTRGVGVGSNSQVKPKRYLVRGVHDPVGDEQEHKAWSPEDAACEHVSWANNVAAEYPDESTVVVTGPDGRSVVVVVTFSATPSYSGRITGELP